MRLFSATYGVRVTRHDKEPLDRDLVVTYRLDYYATEQELRQRLYDVMPMWVCAVVEAPGRDPQESGLVQLAAQSILANLDKGGSLDAPRQLLFEDEDDYGTVFARLWINITHQANRPYKISKEVAACTPS